MLRTPAPLSGTLDRITMSTGEIHLHINIAALQSKYLVSLQNLLDAANLLHAGGESISEEALSASNAVMAFHPAGNARLPIEPLRKASLEWITRSFLRDAIEITGAFLDESLSVCSAIDLGVKGRSKGEEINAALKQAPLKHHRLHLPQKIDYLEQKVGALEPFKGHIISTNKARTCVVHRLGFVSVQDVDEKNELKVAWFTARTWLRGVASGKMTELNRAGIVVEEESIVETHFGEHWKSFGLGEKLQFDSFDIYSTVVTMWRFGNEVISAVERYAKSRGLPLQAPNAV